MKRTGWILGLGAWAVLGGAASALAQSPCAPVETAPGIKSIPAGCNKFARKAAAPASKPGTPAAKPSALFPGTAPGAITKFGDTEVRMNGSVRYEFGIGR